MGGQALAFDRQTGLPIPEDQAAEAVRSGRAGYKPDAVVYMHDPLTGADMEVSPTELDAAYANGYSLLPDAYVKQKQDDAAKQDRYGGFLQGTAAAAEGALSAATFGASDKLLTGFDIGTAERAEMHPGARTLGEIGGTVGSLFVPGGALAKGAGAAARTGQAARVATAAPRLLARGAEALGARAGAAVTRGLGESFSARLLSKAAQLGVAGAAEGAAYGAGQVISEAALKDLDLTAEMILSGIQEGALMGGLLGGGLGVAGEVGATGLRALGRRTGGLRDIAQRNAAAAALGGDRRTVNSIMRRGGEDRIKRIGQRALDDTALMRDPQKALTAIRREADDAVERLGKTAREVTEAGAKIDGAAVLNRLDDQVYRAMGSNTGPGQRVADQMLETLAPVRKKLEAGEAIGFDEAWSVRKDIDELINYDSRNPTPMGNALKEARTVFSEAMDESLARIGGTKGRETLEKWKAANADYSDFAALRGAVEARAAREATKGIVGHGDLFSAGVGALGGLATGSTLTGLATGAALGSANRFARERGSEVIARAADKLSRLDGMMDDSARALAGQRLRTPRRGAAPVALSLERRYEQERADAEANSLPATITARMESVGADFASHPDVMMAVQQGIAADAAYLTAQLPRPTVKGPANTLTSAASAPPPTPSRTDMARFVSQAEALRDPGSVFADVANGKVDLAAIQALKDRRPAAYQDMRSRVMMYAAERGEELPYSQRVVLSLAFDFKADPSMEPATMATIQGSIQQAAAQTQQPGPPPKKNLQTDTSDMDLPSESGAEN